MAKSDKGKKAKGGGGLSVKTFGGLNEKRYTKGQSVDRVTFKKGETVTVQFVAPIDDSAQWKEIDQHQFQDDGWKYVPCLGDDCPLCDDEDRDVSKTSYRFFTNVYDFSQKRFAVLEGPKDLSSRIARKFKQAEKRKKGKFLKTVYDVSKLDQSPVTYEVDIEDDRKPVTVDPKKLIDLDAYIQGQAKRYFGDDMPSEGSKKKKGGKDKRKSSLDDDEDYIEDEEYDEDDLDDMSDKEIKSIAKGMKIALKNPKTDKPRSKETLIKLILKRQS